MAFGGRKHRIGDDCGVMRHFDLRRYSNSRSLSVFDFGDLPGCLPPTYFDVGVVGSSAGDELPFHFCVVCAGCRRRVLNSFMERCRVDKGHK